MCKDESVRVWWGFKGSNMESLETIGCTVVHETIWKLRYSPNLNWCKSASINSMQYSLFEAGLNSFAWPTNKPILLWAIIIPLVWRVQSSPCPQPTSSTKGIFHQHHTSFQPQFCISLKENFDHEVEQQFFSQHPVYKVSLSVKLYHLESGHPLVEAFHQYFLEVHFLSRRTLIIQDRYGFLTGFAMFMFPFRGVWKTSP